MNILILSPFFPYPLSQGGKIRVFNIIKYLSRSHKITLACLSEEKVSDYGPLKDYCEGILVTRRKPSVAKDLLRFLAGTAPFNYVRYSSREMEMNLSNLLGMKSFDLVQAEFSMMWQYAHIFKDIPVVLDAHNVESEIVRQIGATQGNPLKKSLYSLEERRLKKRETEAWRESKLCFAVSEKERNYISSHLDISEKVFTIPNGVDLERFTFLPRDATAKQLLFIGGMEYLPNLDSAHYFLTQIFPLIKSSRPDTKLDMVGRELWRIRKRSTSKDVRFHENVPDVLPFFRNADVLLVPLRYGAGTRIKILEAMAAGVAVVSTSKGCEGIGSKHAEHLMVADTPGAFSDAVLDLLGHPSLQRALTRNARSLIEEKYSWEKIVANTERAYDLLLLKS